MEVDPAKDLAVLQYTGGTTGRAKGAMLTHANVSANARQLVQHAECERIGVKRVLGVLPLFHVFAMQTVMLIPICLGAEIIPVPRFNLMSLLDDIEREKPTMFPACRPSMPPSTMWGTSRSARPLLPHAFHYPPAARRCRSMCARDSRNSPAARWWKATASPKARRW